MILKDWMNKATEEEREAVAQKANTSVGYLWQLSGGHRGPSRDLAALLESAMELVTPDRVVSRLELLYPEENNKAA